MVVPRRTIGHIERPFATLPNNKDAWFTVVKRYGFDKNNTEFSTLNKPSSIVEVLNSENVQKVRELFNKRINDQAKIQDQVKLIFY